MRWPKLFIEMAKDGDLLMQAITGVPQCPERRKEQIRRRIWIIDRERDALQREYAALAARPSADGGG